jgi:hypothetical protein
LRGSAGVIALVLAQIVAGASVFLWLTPIWTEVKRGFFKLMGITLVILAGLAWASASAGQIKGSPAVATYGAGIVAPHAWGVWSVRLAAASTAVIAVWMILVFARRATAARIVGFASVVVTVGVLAAMAGTGRQSYALCLFQLLAGAAFLGTVLDSLMLGHWYLTDRGLPRKPIERYATAVIAAVFVEAVAVVSAGFSGTASSQAFNPLLTAGALAPWIALGMVAATGLIAFLAKAALRGERASAVQSATGFYYLAVVTSLTAELAVKTRFFPA